MSTGNGGAANVPIFLTPNERPKDLFGAISHLEIVYEAEKSGTELPEKFTTLKDRMDYFNLEMRSILGGSFISVLLAPLSSAVIGNHMPISGSFDPSVSDKVIAYILSFGYTIAYMMLFVYAAKLQRSTMSAIISSNLIAGMTLGAIIKLFLAAFVYGLMYFIVLTPDNIVFVFKLLIRAGISEGIYEFIRFVITAIRASLIPTIYIFFLTTVALIIVPWSVVIYTKINNKPKEL